MTPEERQAMRDKHCPFEYRDGTSICLGCDSESYIGGGTDYPCDVIKVLDATEPTEPEVPINWAAGK